MAILIKVVHWDDIPYAEPPIGDLRWKAPRKLNVISEKNIKTSRE